MKWSLLAMLAVFAACHPVAAPAEKSKEKAEAGAEKKAAGKSEEAEHRDEPEHEELPTRVHVEPKVVADAGIKLAPVTREVLAPTMDLPGEVAADPDRTAKISPLVGGRVDTVQFREGQAVKAGDVLATLLAPSLAQNKAASTATAAKALAAKANLGRLRALAGERLAGKQELATATAEADALQAEADAAKGTLKALGASDGGVATQLVLRAPLSGSVLARHLVVGQHVEPTDLLGVVADLQEVWFLARVFERNLERLHLGALADVQLNAYGGAHFAGKVELVSPQADPATHTVLARIRLQNPDGLLRPGLFGVAHVGTGEPNDDKPVLVVDHKALTEIGGKTVVFVGHPDGDFERHDVVVGRSALGKVEIVSGLREGELVVTEGVFTLRSLLLKSTFAEEE